jgi:hypothetical protein
MIGVSMRQVLVVSLVCLLLGQGPGPVLGAVGGEVDGRSGPSRRNVRGIHTLAASRAAIDAQLQWAEQLIGPGGAVTQPFLGIVAQTREATADAVAYVEQAYARQLDPILVLQGRYVNRDGCNATGYVGWLAPIPDDADGPDGPAEPSGYLQEAEGYRRFVAGLPRMDGRTLSVQIGNEPNLHEMWGGAANPAEYARFFADVAAAIHSVGDPRIRVLNAALAPEGDVDNLQFIGQAIEAEPRFGLSFDDWASHPYPRNRPPASNLHDGTASPGSRYTIDAYLLELEALKRAGVNRPDLQVVLTETGYELGDRHHPEYPAVSEELRAAYIAQALDAYWPHWPEVRSVTPFELAGWYGSWRSFDWVWPSSGTTPHGLPTQPRLQYARLLPDMGVVTGVARDDRGAPLKDVSIVAEPGGFAATSLADGSFVLLAQPGRYRLHARKDGHADATRGDVPVLAQVSTSLDLTLPAVLTTSLRNASFESDDLAGWTVWGDVDGVQDGLWFGGVQAEDGQRFLGTAVNCGAKDGGAQQSVSAQAGSTVTVGVWTLTSRDGPAGIGTRSGIDPWGGTDPTSSQIVWSAPVETGGVWQRVEVSARAESDRVTVLLAHDQDAANPWNVSAFDGVELVQGP